MVDLLANDSASQPVVFLEYNVDYPPPKRYDRWWAAFSGSTAFYPMVMVNSGHQVRTGYSTDLYNIYKGMVDAELARAPLADFEAYSWRVDNHVKFSGQMTNRSGQILSAARNDATLHALVYEDAHVGVTNRFVRAVVSQPISADLPSGGSISIDLETPDLTGVNWANLHTVVMADYRPNGSSGAYDMLQAARADFQTFPLYFPHIATSIPWQTEIAIINTSDQTVAGTLRGLSDKGELVDTKAVTLSARGRRQIAVADEFINHTNIAYIIFETSSSAVQGYAKFYREGYYRAAIPAVKEVNTSDIYLPHIAATVDWWTGVSMVNTTSTPKQLTITFNSGQSRQLTLDANQHRAVNIAQEFFNNQPQPDIQSAVIANASGVIGLELFGSLGWGNQLEGIPLTDKTTQIIYYPHVAGNEWWTGIVAYNPSDSPTAITITPYSAAGSVLPISTLPLAGKEKYVGAVSALGLPAQTAWFRIDSPGLITGFELFGTTDGNQLAAYAGGGGAGAKAGVFAKIEKHGWTGIAFVNTEASAAAVTLTAYDDNGNAVATQVLPVGGYAKVVNPPAQIFSQDIGSATYIAYSSDKNVVGFQLNGSADGKMLDGLPALVSTN